MYRQITISREKDHDLKKYKDISIDLEEDEVVTVGRVRDRLSDSLNLHSNMIAIVNGDAAPSSRVLEDGDAVHFKSASREKG